MVRIVARCVHGLEWATAAEIARVLGVEGVLARREIVFDLPTLTGRVLDLRCCDDAFRQVGAPCRVGSTKADLPAMGRDVARLDWPDAVSAVAGLRPAPPATFDCVASVEGHRSYSRYAVEDVVGAALAPGLGLRPLSRAGGGGGSGDLTVRLFVRDGTVAAALRIAARPLHRRPWKLDTGPGTLHPPLAAALVTLLADGPVHDPFCGDGTLAIEAALAGHPATAADLDPVRVANARANAGRAGVAVTVREADAALSVAAGIVLTNPPWDRTVRVSGRATLGSFLDTTADAPVCLLTDAELDVPGELRRRGVAPTLATRLRVGGRVADVTLAGVTPPPDLARRREDAIAAGVVTEHGF